MESDCSPLCFKRSGGGGVSRAVKCRTSGPAVLFPPRGELETREKAREREREREGRAIGSDSGAGRAAAGARRPQTVDLWEENGMRTKRTWPAVFRGAGAGCPRWLLEPLDSGRGPAELQWTLPAAGRRAEHPRRCRRRGGRAARPEPARSAPLSRRGTGSFLFGIAPVTAGCASRPPR